MMVHKNIKEKTLNTDYLRNFYFKQIVILIMLKELFLVCYFINLHLSVF